MFHYNLIYFDIELAKDRDRTLLYLVVEVLVDLCEMVDVSLVKAALVVESLSLEVQLRQVLK